MGTLLLLPMISIAADAAPRVELQGVSHRGLLSFDRGTGLSYAPKGLKAAPNATRRSYSVSRGRARVVANLGAGVNITQLAQAACNTANVADPSCEDVLLLALTPAKYSSNSTADTPGCRTFISPAQDQGICGSLQPRVNCLTGSSYEDVLRSLDEGRVAQWAARDCFPYLGDASSTEDCAQLSSGLCNSQLPEGAVFSVAGAGSALTTMARVKEQIMLTGGVFTSTAMSPTAFSSFLANKTAASGIFTTSEDASRLDPATITMHAVFCYGWWDSPSTLGDGYWICKNSWGPSWGLGGSFRVAYGSAFIMQPDNTFALQFNKVQMTQRVEDIKQRLKPDLAYDPTAAGCVLYTPRQPQRLLQLVQPIACYAPQTITIAKACPTFAVTFTTRWKPLTFTTTKWCCRQLQFVTCQ
ncbi:hypothetical protein OEZ85_002863 [Tetradesmus obliquus]|uniref:Peptidase C1A papain C-terminal domain-containing protein n=1 Tax=Tetradesmus obliquus TaxID=3088 RepID=A0ABY8U124_TETOB|nr:hypothetical protein OEZ85_002863 [Tetradesmus obliquus]